MNRSFLVVAGLVIMGILQGCGSPHSPQGATNQDLDAVDQQILTDQEFANNVTDFVTEIASEIPEEEGRPDPCDVLTVESITRVMPSLAGIPNHEYTQRVNNAYKTMGSVENGGNGLWIRECHYGSGTESTVYLTLDAEPEPIQWVEENQHLFRAGDLPADFGSPSYLSIFEDNTGVTYIAEFIVNKYVVSVTVLGDAQATEEQVLTLARLMKDRAQGL